MLRSTSTVRLVPILASSLLMAACGAPPPVTPTAPVPASAAAPAVSANTPANSAAAAPNGTSPEAPSGYDKPPQNILDVMHAPSPPQAVISPTHDRVLLVSWQDYPSIARVATPFLRLAGVRVEPGNHSRHDTPGGYDITPCATDFTLTHIPDGAQTKVALPAKGCAGRPAWTTDGKRFAFQNITADSVELWIGDGTTGEAHRVEGVRLNPMLGDTVQWMADQKTLLVKLVPSDLGPPPPPVVVTEGPSIQETNAQKGESSTYETRDTLTGKYDEDLFDYYVSSQLAVVDAGTGAVTPIGNRGAFAGVDPSPDGEHILVATIHKPYSYVTTADRFPNDLDVWDRHGVVQHRMASLPLADRVPVHGVPTGPREFAWRATEPATLVWAEALDGGDWNTKVPARDKVMLQRAPFTAPAVEVTRTEQRFEGFYWSEKAATTLLVEDDENRHWMRTFVMNPDDPRVKPSVVWDLSTDEHYKAPGDPVLRRLPSGFLVLQQDGDAIYTSGPGSSPDGDRPFLDRFDLKTRKSERLFRSAKAAYEVFLAFTGANGHDLLTWHQSPSDPPNLFVRTLGSAVASPAPGEPAFASASVAVTHLPDPAPAVRAITKRLVKYKRKDGVDLSFTLYLPPGYKEGTRVPAILYAYPLDYADASKAGQITGSEETFTRLARYRLLLLAGYAIIDQAAFPIVGDPKKAYDTYQEQLSMDARAAVDKAVALGVVDPERIGVTGHSHGALMTANLLAHTDLFRAGVATSGSYNKTLTPFGFQSERRSVWQAQNVYLQVSPFFFSDKLKAPILIMHGEEDANPGTTPIQATKLFEAIRGNGGTARLVLLPHEPHHYTAMESNEQVIYEMVRWFDKYVKNAPPRSASEKAAGPKATGAKTEGAKPTH